MELDALLATLSKYGVTEAEFSDDGSLKRVEMIPLALGGGADNDLPGGDSEQTATGGDAAALRMLARGKREQAA